MNKLVNGFDAPIGALGQSDEASVAAIASAAADLVLILDLHGVVRDIRLCADDRPYLEQSHAWLGRPWVETVTAESRPRVEAMLAEVREHGISRRAQVDHPRPDGPDLAVAYTAVRLDREGTVAGIGRDLRALARLQRQLVEVQQVLERDHTRMRHMETRYRLLLELSDDAVMVIDATTMKIMEANSAAVQLLGLQARAMAATELAFGLDPAGQLAASAYLAAVRTVGRAEPVRVSLSSGGRAALLSAALVRQEDATLFLVRLRPEASESAATSSANARLSALIGEAPDAFVVTDLAGRVLTANTAFLDLAQVATEEQVRGRSVAQWIGRPGADLEVLLAALREHGVVRLFSTAARGQYGSTGEVEVSAVAAPKGAAPCIGIVLRDVGRRLAAGPPGARNLSRAVEQLTELVGRVSLRDLVRDTVGLVERHFIEAALELTRDNRTSAAEVLGVSRQSLYVKLRRYDLGGTSSHTEVP
jgi:transcriptional regulator PpsR